MINRSEERGGIYLAIGIVWLAVAGVLGGTGRLAQLRPPAPQLILIGLTLLLWAGCTRGGGLRGWVDRLPIRTLVSLHITRLVIGLYFLYLARTGGLASGFAVPAGWGDIAVGALALGLTVSGAAGDGNRAAWVRAWNWLGFVDLVFVVATAARIGVSDPASMGALFRLPLSLLPTFWVPVLLVSHLVLARRLRRANATVAAPGTA